MKMLVVFSMSVLFVLNVFGQKMGKKAIETSKISLPTIYCEKAKADIEFTLKYIDGIQKAVVDFKKKILTVTYITDRTDKEQIKTHIANMGYDADDVKANPEAYAKLPTSCKKPEDRPDYKPIKAPVQKKDN